MKIVRVQWLDAYSEEAMLKAEDHLRTGSMEVEDVGRLLGENRHYIHLAPRRLCQDGKVYHCNFMSIPKKWVKNIEVLKEID